MKGLHKKYTGFLEKLNNQNIPWCLIKDYDYLMKTGYDNEIDIVANSNDRNNIRSIARKLGWNESTLNKFNTHLYFWKFEEDKPFRIDVHIGRVLATAVPWFKSKQILADKIKKGSIFTLSPSWELVLLLLGSFRGRKPKKYRIEQAKKLKLCLSAAKKILYKRLTEKEVEKYYDYLVKGKIIRFSKIKRLDFFGIIKEKVLLIKLFFLRSLNPSPVVLLSCDDVGYRDKVQTALIQKLIEAKINVKSSKNPLNIFLKRIMSDIVVVGIRYNKWEKSTYSLNKEEPINKSVKKIISKIY